MNTANNKRYKKSNEKIETAFLTLMLDNNYENITISEICNKANVNRSTFYAHYDDINDLIIKTESKFAHSMISIFNYGLRYDHEAFVEMFKFVKENKYFYKAFLKIPYTTLAESNTKDTILHHVKGVSPQTNDMNDIELMYRGNFFGAGIKTICSLWLERDCKESPEEMANILRKEYTNRKYY